MNYQKFCKFKSCETLRIVILVKQKIRGNVSIKNRELIEKKKHFWYISGILVNSYKKKLPGLFTSLFFLLSTFAMTACLRKYVAKVTPGNWKW